MKLSKRSLIVVLSLVMAMSLSVFSTVAYLTSSAQATNTFTVGDVEIDLDETDVDENGNPKYPVDTDGDGEPDVEISIDEDGVITVDPTPDDDSDDPIVIEPDENGDYPPTDIDGDGDEDNIEVDDNGNIIVKPEGGDPTTVVPGADVTIDDDGTITIDPTPDDDTDEPIVIKPNEDGTYPDTDVDGDGDKDKIEVDEDGNITITDPDGNTIVIEPDRDTENDYNLVPGEEYLKDPTVTIKGGSEKAYARMRIAFTTLPDGMDAKTLFDTMVADLDTEHWDYKGVNADGELEFWYMEGGEYVAVRAGSADVELAPLFTTIKLPGETTSEELQDYAGVQMQIYGDAIQAASFDDAEAAWEAFDGQNG